MNAIEQAREVVKKLRKCVILTEISDINEVADAIDALIAELESIKTGQEPVAWLCCVLQADASWRDELSLVEPPKNLFSVRKIRPLVHAAGAQPLTPAMIMAGQHAWMTADGVDPARVYRAMLAEAGTQPQSALNEINHAIDALVAKAPHDAGVIEMDVLGQITAEVARATEKFPTWPTDPLHALAVLGEEFGELTKAMLQLTYEPHKTSAEDVRMEAIQTAAMAIRLTMSLDRYRYAPCRQHTQGETPNERCENDGENHE